MNTITVNKKIIPIDSEGFLLDFKNWDEEVANHIAESIGLMKLDFEHWKLIWYLRGYVKKNDSLPMLHDICQDTGMSLKKIYLLFPGGPVRGAFRIAGLPKPIHCT